MILLFRFGLWALFLSLIVLLAVRKRYFESMAICFVFAVVSFLAMEAKVFAFYLAAIPLLLILKNRQARPMIVSAVMVTWAVSGLVTSVVSDLREYRDIHAKYPLESLASRLSYEIPHVSNESQDFPASVREAEMPADEEWNARGDASRARRRHAALKELNSQTFAEFIAANGFGASRMQSFRRWNMKLDRVPSAKPLPKRPEIIEPLTAIQNPELAAGNFAQPAPPLPSQLEAVREFTAMVDWAYVPVRQQAVGFVAHAMQKTPVIRGASAEEWQVSRLELVSLLKFAEPRVYSSEHLPRMEDLRNTETRSLDEFEQRALQQLRGREDIVTDQQLNTIRMVGAVRASKQCLDCHSVRRGDLLGAFSYLLDRKQLIPPPKVEGKPVSMIRKRSQDS